MPSARVAPDFAPVAPLAGPSGMQDDDAQLVVVDVQPEPRSWPADVAFDTRRRLEWTRRILETEQVYSIVERATIARGMALLGSFEVGRGTAKALKHTASTLDRARVKHDPQSGHLIGDAQAVVHTSVMDLVAYIMQQDSRHILSTCDPAVDLRFEVLETVNDHHIVIFMEKHPGKPVQNRTFLTSVLCVRLSDEPLSYAVVSEPLAQHPKISRADEENRIRAEAMRCFQMTALGPAKTLLEYACWLDVNGHLPKRIMETISIPIQMGVPYGQQKYFLQVSAPSGWTAEHSAHIGHMLLDTALAAPKSGRVAAIEAFVAQTAALNEPMLRTWLPPFAAEMSSGRLRRAQSVSAPLAELNGADGTRIGRRFNLALAMCVDAPSAVDDWLREFPAMQEACAAWPWFKPMVLVMAQRRLQTVGWGVAFRVVFCAILSYADMGSDLYTFFQYRAAGQDFFASATLTILGVSMLMQLVLVITQDHRSLPAMLKGMFFVASFAKPALDARRVVKGAVQEAHQLFSPFVEQVVSKVLEVAFESTPAAFLQMWGLVLILSTANQQIPPNPMQILSILISALTAAFVVASTFYDLDILPRNRALEPSFYGLFPDSDKRRSAVLFVMTLAAFCKLLGLVLAFALFIVAEHTVVVGAAYAVRIALVFVVKAARRDLPWYWPTRGGATLFCALCGRISTAILVDFADFHYARHPFDHGAILWLFGLVWPWPFLFAGVATYNAHFWAVQSLQVYQSNATDINSAIAGYANATLPDQGANVAAIDAGMLWTLAGVLAFVWLCSNIAFALLCKREYLRTYWSTETAAQYTKRTKWDGATDAKRARVLTKLHSSYLRLFRDEARQWLADNWDEWAEQRPKWFSERWKRALPNSVLTPALRAQLGGKARRRSSVAEQMRQ